MSEPEQRDLEAMFGTYLCPDCGHGLVFLPGPPHLLRCNICEKDFFAPDDSEEDDQIDLSQTVELPQLNRSHVTQLASMRRALYRSRSYAIVAALACVGVVIQLGWLAFRHVRDEGWELRPISFVAAILVGIVGVIWFIRRAIALHHDTRRSLLDEPTTTPDFSTLSDGSQQAQNLEDIR